MSSSDSDSSSSSSSNSSSSSSDSDDIVNRKQILKPVFISKNKRITMKEQEMKELNEQIINENKIKHESIKKLESQRLVIEHLKKEEEDAMHNSDEEELINTDDEDELVAYELWTIRELKRIKRDRDLRESLEEEDKELEKRRQLSDEEIMKLDQHKFDKKAKEKGKPRFLQKYYHKGAFYIDEYDEYQRDFTQATGEDAMVDKSTLPKVLQVKKFGLKNQTKYTHLKDQDTTNFEDERLRQDFGFSKPKRKLAGTGNIVTKKKARTQ